MIHHFHVVMTYPDGSRVAVAPPTRRFGGAQSVRDAAVSSKANQLRNHAQPGERVVVGPDALRGVEIEATVVVITGPRITAAYRYAIEPEGPARTSGC